MQKQDHKKYSSTIIYWKNPDLIDKDCKIFYVIDYQNEEELIVFYCYQKISIFFMGLSK